MADTKISALAAASAAAAANELAINEAGTSKKITITQLQTLLQTLGMPRITRLGSQHSISSTAGTEVTGLQQTLEAGTFTFTYWLIVRSATGTVSPMYGVNFTGTHTVLNMHMRYADDTTALTGQVGEADNQGNTGFGFIGGMAQNTESTTAPNMGHTVGVGATAADILIIIDGLIIVTVTGDLEFWHSSETNTATSIEVGSSLVVTRTA